MESEAELRPRTILWLYLHHPASPILMQQTQGYHPAFMRHPYLLRLRADTDFTVLPSVYEIVARKG